MGTILHRLRMLLHHTRGVSEATLETRLDAKPCCVEAPSFCFTSWRSSEVWIGRRDSLLATLTLCGSVRKPTRSFIRGCTTRWVTSRRQAQQYSCLRNCFKVRLLSPSSHVPCDTCSVGNDANVDVALLGIAWHNLAHIV